MVTSDRGEGLALFGGPAPKAWGARSQGRSAYSNWYAGIAIVR